MLAISSEIIEIAVVSPSIFDEFPSISSFVLLFFFWAVILSYECSNLTQYLKNYCTMEKKSKIDTVITSSRICTHFTENNSYASSIIKRL